MTHALEMIRRRGSLAPGEFRLLSYVAEQYLAGASNSISQKTIAADVFGRDIQTFDPRADSIVRTTATKLREALQAYYAGPGRGDPIVVEMPRGSYVPAFSRRAPVSLDASSRLWSARVALQARTVSGYETAIKLLDAVLAEHPDLSLALALKAEALASRAIHGSRPRPSLEQARELAARALERTSPAWQAWLATAIVQQALEWNWPEAEKSYCRALESSGGESATHVWYTAFLVGRGRVREAVSHLQETVDHFGYTNPAFIGDLSMLLILARDYAAAATAIQSALESAPNYYQHHINHAILLEAQGDPAGALRALKGTPLRLLERPSTWGLRALFAGLSGEPKIARRRARWLHAIRQAGRYIPPGQFAICSLGEGDLPSAVRWLEAAAEERDPLTVWFCAYPFLRHLQRQKGYRELIDCIGLVWF